MICVQYIVWFIMHHFPCLAVFCPEGGEQQSLQNAGTDLANGAGSHVWTLISILNAVGILYSVNLTVLQSSMNTIKKEPESDESQPPSPRELYEPVFIKTEHFEPDALPIMKCEAVVSLVNSETTDFIRISYVIVCLH
jgi:hypothetical protein